VRTINRETSFHLVAEKVLGSLYESDQRYMAVEWRLAVETDWTGYAQIQQTPAGVLMAVPVGGSAAFPGLVIYFTVNASDTHVHMHDLLPATP
jgi:hypothetical protein